MRGSLNLKKTKEKINKVLAQAKDSIKVLDSLQKEGLARARSIMKQVPAKDMAQRIANERVVASLKRLGLATRGEVRELDKKVEQLASELRAQISQVSKAARKAKKEKDDAETPGAKS